MKYIVILFFFVTSIVTAQSREETVNWLNQKFVECKDINHISVRPQENSRDGEFLTILNHYGSIAYAYNLNPNSIKAITTYRAEAGNYNLKITGDEIAEIQYEFDLRRNANEVSKKNVYVINLVTDAKASDIEKLKKGLVHLINLLGGNLIKKDLFED